MQAQFEVVILPVSDPDESLRFYRDQVGFDLDVDYPPTPDFRVIQHGYRRSRNIHRMQPPGAFENLQP